MYIYVHIWTQMYTSLLLNVYICLYKGRGDSFLDKMKRGLSLNKIASNEVYDPEDRGTYAFGWCAFLCKIRFVTSLIVLLTSSSYRCIYMSKKIYAYL
jgi:hypothetical protein